MTDRKVEIPEPTSAGTQEPSSEIRGDVKWLGKAMRDSKNWAGGGEGQEALAALSAKGRQGDQLAIRYLLTSVVPTPGDPFGAQRASGVRSELASIYADPKTPPAVRSQIATSCRGSINSLVGRLQSLPTRNGDERLAKAEAAKDARRDLAPLMELAIDCHRTDPPNSSADPGKRWSDLGRKLDQILYVPEGVQPEDMLSNTRYMRHAEVLTAVSDLANVPVISGAVSVAVPLIGGNDDLSCFARASVPRRDQKTGSSATPPAPSALEFAAARGRPVGMLMNVGGRHWTYVAVFPPRDDGTVPCLMFDSLKSVKTSLGAKLIESKLKASLAKSDAFGGGKLSLAFEVHGGDLQDNAKNACGGFSAWAATQVDQRVGSGNNPADARRGFAEIPDMIRPLPADDQRKHFIATRALGLAAAVSSMA